MSYSSKNLSTQPIVLSISGHDPTGGAGIQADSEVFTHFDCHPCSIITCLTVQDSSTVYRLIPLEAEDIIEQAKVLFNDMPIKVIKIGLTGSINVVNAIVDIIKSHPNIPVVFDPVLACGDGTPLANTELINEIKNKLLPLTTVLTPNTIEAAQLSGLQDSSDPEQLGRALLNQGVDNVLVTGGHASGSVIRNHLFGHNKKIATSEWKRQVGDFHGTGCTLASAIAALMAKGLSIPDAVESAQKYVNNAIEQARKFGKGQHFPNHIQK